MSVLTTRMTAQEFKAMKKPKKSKYGNKKVTVDGVTFDSQGEYARWCELKALQQDGHITGLERQVPFDLSVEGQKITKYIADFTYFELICLDGFDGLSAAYVVEDFKSKATITASYRLKKKLMLAIHGIDIRETFARAA